MSPLKHQQLINLINRLDLPAERVQTLREDLTALRCGLNLEKIAEWVAMMFGDWIGGSMGKLVYGTS